MGLSKISLLLNELKFLVIQGEEIDSKAAFAALEQQFADKKAVSLFHICFQLNHF